MVRELVNLPNDVLDRLNAACHETTKFLQGSAPLCDAMRNEAFCEVLKLELASFEAIKNQYLTNHRKSL